MKKFVSLLLVAIFLTSAVYAEGEGEPEGEPEGEQETIVVDVVGMGDYVTGLITALGTVLGSVVGGYFAILLVKKGLRWANGIDSANVGGMSSRPPRDENGNITDYVPFD